MRHKRRSLLAFVVIFSALFLSHVGSLAPEVVANPEVFANPDEVRYEGTGGLILPASVNSGTRNEVIRCRGCSWKLTVACVPGPNNYCDAGIRACPGLIDHMRVWFKPVSGDWNEVDRICLTNYEVTTVDDLEYGISAEFTRYVPEQAARCWPTQGAVTQIPLICQSGQRAEPISWRLYIAGFDVGITTSPSWTWNFHGSILNTRDPGGPYPNREISHTFRTPGDKTVGIVTRWSGNFSVDNLDPVSIDRELIQGSLIPVTIGQAKARLRCPGVGGC